MLDDLTLFKRPGFRIFTEEEAGKILGAILALVVILDLCGVWK